MNATASEMAEMEQTSMATNALDTESKARWGFVMGINGWTAENGWVRHTAGEIVDALDASIPLHAAHQQAVREIVARGSRYSNEDGDVLSAASAVRSRTEAREWELPWIARMLSEANQLVAA